jgi:hypothetical protein
MPKRTAWLLIALGALAGLAAGAALDRYVASHRPPPATAGPEPWSAAGGQAQRQVVPATRIASELDLPQLLKDVVADRASSSDWAASSAEPNTLGGVSKRDAAVSCTLKDAGQGPAIAQALIANAETFIESRSGKIWEQTGNTPGGGPPVRCRYNLGYRLDRRAGRFMIYAAQYNDQLDLSVYFFETDDE